MIRHGESQAARFGVETAPAPIETIDASVDLSEITEYPEYRGSERDRDMISFADSRKLRACLGAQAGVALHAKRMRRARPSSKGNYAKINDESVKSMGFNSNLKLSTHY